MGPRPQAVPPTPRPVCSPVGAPPTPRLNSGGAHRLQDLVSTRSICLGGDSDETWDSHGTTRAPRSWGRGRKGRGRLPASAPPTAGHTYPFVNIIAELAQPSARPSEIIPEESDREREKDRERELPSHRRTCQLRKSLRSGSRIPQPVGPWAGSGTRLPGKVQLQASAPGRGPAKDPGDQGRDTGGRQRRFIKQLWCAWHHSKCRPRQRAKRCPLDLPLQLGTATLNKSPVSKVIRFWKR